MLPTSQDSEGDGGENTKCLAPQSGTEEVNRKFMTIISS